MKKIIAFSKNTPDKEEIASIQEEPDIDAMSRQELEEYLHKLEESLAQLDAREPRNPNSEAYEDWADEHEDLEDQIDEVLDLLDDL